MKPTRLAAWILIGLGLLAAWQVSLIPAPPVYAELGPRFAPAVSAALLTALALAYWFADRKALNVDTLQDPEEGPLEGAASRIQWYALGLASLIILIPIAGLGPAGAVAFAGIARSFGSQRSLVDLAVGAAFTGLVWVLFAKGLGVQLGPLMKGVAL